MNYSQEERAIFRYHNGQKIVCGDPQRINRRLLSVRGFNLEAAKHDMESGDFAVMSEAAEKMLGAIVHAFEIKPLDPNTGEGMMESDVFKLMTDFGMFMAEVKKKEKNLPSCSPPTVQELFKPAASATPAG